MDKVFITDIRERSALAIIRSLGRKGIRVEGSEYFPFPTGRFSKYLKKFVKTPSPFHSPIEFVDFFKEYLKVNDYSLIIPPAEASSFLFSYFLKKDYGDIIGVPDFDVFKYAHDKGKTVKICEKEGIPVPKTYFINSMDELKYIAKEIKYPAVIKPRSKFFVLKKGLSYKVAFLKVGSKNYVENSCELVERYMEIVKPYLPEIEEYGFLPLIQERVSGRGWGVAVIFDRDKPLCGFMHRRIYEYPPTGGASTLRVSVWQKDIFEKACKLLKAIKWKGVAMVEFKVDENSKKFWVMEINGRFWGSLPLAINSGVDFPYLFYLYWVKGKRFSKFVKSQEGIFQKWGSGQVLRFFWFLKRFKFSRVFEEFLNTFFISDDVFTLRDPLPAVGEVLTFLNFLREIKKGLRTAEGESRR